MTKFLLQTTDPNAPSVLNGRAPFIPFAWMGGSSDLWDEALGIRNYWKRLRDMGIPDRPICLFGVMGWALQIPGFGYHTDWEQITRLWNGLPVDIGAPVMLLRRFIDASMHDYPDWPKDERFPTFIHCMHEGSHWVRWIDRANPVHTKVVPNLVPRVDPYTSPGDSDLAVRAINAETRESRRVLRTVGWSGSKFSREDVHAWAGREWAGAIDATDNLGTYCKTMYEPPRNAADAAWIRANGPQAVPHLCAARSDFPELLAAMRETGTTHCNVFCGNSRKLDQQNHDGLMRLAKHVAATWPGTRIS